MIQFFGLDDSSSIDFLDFFMFADVFGSEGRARLMSLAREVLDLPDIYLGGTWRDLR